MKLAGTPLAEIADELGYESPQAVAAAIRAQMKTEATFLSESDRMATLQMELDRLDRIQAKLWPGAMMGDPKSAEAVLKVIDRRIRITGLDSVDTQTQQHTLLIIGGQEQEYVEKLKELVEGDKE